MADQSVKIDISLEEQTLASFDRLDTLLDEGVKKTNELKNATIALNKARGTDDEGQKMDRYVKAQAKVLKNTQDITIEKEKQANLDKQAGAEAKLLREAEAANKTKGAYSTLNKELNKATTEYQNIIAKQQQKIALTPKETASLGQLANKVKVLGAAYNRTNQQMAKTMGARKAKASFDSLGFSVAQMTRESPAFLISMNTGFMALSNNIPIFVDEIRRAKEANDLLKGSQEKGLPVWKQVTKAIFSWQSAISLGILALTVLGPKIGEMVKLLMSADEVTDGARKSMEGYNNALLKGEQNAQKRIKTLEYYQKALLRGNITEEQRLKITTELRDEFGEYIEDVDDAALAQGLFSDEIDEATKSMIAQAKVQASFERMVEIEKELLKVRKDLRGLPEGEVDIEGVGGGSLIPGADYLMGAMTGRAAGTSIEQARNDAMSKENELLGEQALLQAEVTNSIEDWVDAQGLSLDKTKKLKKERQHTIDTTLKGSNGMIEVIEEMIALYEKLAKASATLEDAEPFTQMADGLKKSLAEIKKTGGLGVETIDPSTMYAKFDPANLPGDTTKASKFLEKNQKEIDVAVEFGNQMIDLGSAILDRQLENINAEIIATEEKYDRLYELAEGDQYAQEQITRRKLEDLKVLEKEELKIRQKQAKLQKVQAVSNILISTAEALIKAYADGGPFLGSALGVGIAALGAASVATVLAQPIPQYAKGREGGREELAIVGDGGRREVIMNKDGSAFLTPNKPTLAMLEKGANVYKNENTYRDSILNSIQSDLGLDPQSIEDAIAKGFEKAKVNNYIKLAPAKIDIGHELWLLKNSNF